MMMQKTNKLIDDFKNQTMNTIWKHLNRMAGNYSIYCTHLNGLDPFLTDYDIYLYCNDTAVVIVCLDCCGNSEEQTYEESETLSSLVMAEGCEPRISMVWKMAEAVRHVKNCLQSTNPSIEVYGVLLTEANITNFVKLYQMWEAHGVTVIDYLNRLKYKNIKVNCYENDDLPCKNYVQAIIDASSAAAKPEQPTTYNRDDDDEEFKKTSDELSDIFKKTLNKDTLNVKVEKLKDESISSVITLNEESKRMQQMMKVYGMTDMNPAMFESGITLTLNANNDLVKYVLNHKDDENTEMICKQLYDLALISHKQLSADEMTNFIKRSNDIMLLLTKES